MIRILFTKFDKYNRTMFLGLSGEDMTRLVAGEPVFFNGKSMGFEGNICITYGKTEEDINEQLKGLGLFNDT